MTPDRDTLTHLMGLCIDWRDHFEKAASECDGDESYQALRLRSKAEGCDLIRACIEEQLSKVTMQVSSDGTVSLCLGSAEPEAG